MILGTAAYMSPEQARGKPVDKRTDIWAFGVVLFEMLTGQRLFAGETVTDMLAAVLKTEIDVASCRRRLRPPSGSSCADASSAIRGTASTTSPTRGSCSTRCLRGEGAATGTGALPRRRPRALAAIPWSVAALAVATAIAVGLRPCRRPPALPRPLTAFGILMPEDYFLSLRERRFSTSRPMAAPGLHRSGRGRRASSAVRSIGWPSAASKAPTVPRNPALSPDGRWIAFFEGGVLARFLSRADASVAVAEARPRAA